MRPDARSLLNKMHRGGRKTVAVTDARDVLTLKYAQKKRHLGPMNRVSVQLNKFSNQNFKRFNNNFNRNKGFANNNNRSNFNTGNRRQLPHNLTNWNPGSSVKRGRQGILQRTIRGDVLQDKRVFSNREGITVVKKVSTRQANIQMDEDEDELEKMTLADLPDVKFPAGLLSSGTPTHFVSSKSSTLPVMSRLDVAEDSMVADTFLGQQINISRCVLVTNLLPSVSEQDVLELFGSVGSLVNLQTVRSGEMIVEYVSPSDALLAIRQFDGIALDQQVMYCSLVPIQEPRPLTSRLGEKTSTFTPITSPLSPTPSIPYHQATSARKNVKFIVQLP